MALSAGRFHSLALDSNGKPWAWGDNQSGALGRDPAETSESLFAVSVQDYSA
jgi:alpha-tubulin suppressor-like RCC1 family protein